MARSLAHRFVLSLSLLALAAALAAGRPALGADGPETTGKAWPKTTRPKGRLPAYYGQVVTEEQRQKIYEIQEQYSTKINAMEERLRALKNERDEKVAAVLTAEQKKKVEEAGAKARQKQKPAEVTPAASPAEQKRRG